MSAVHTVADRIEPAALCLLDDSSTQRVGAHIPFLLTVVASVKPGPQFSPATMIYLTPGVSTICDCSTSKQSMHRTYTMVTVTMLGLPGDRAQVRYRDL